jgi:peptidoglycan-associated lipoprotein
MRFSTLNIIILPSAMTLAGCVATSGTSPSTQTVAAKQNSATTPQIIPGSAEDLCANVGDRVFFDFNASSLMPSARKTLDLQAGFLTKYPHAKIQIAGNTDDSGTQEYNLALGNRRAAVVRDYLIAKGITPTRITIISYGKSRPAAPGGTDADRAKNRNATTSLA